MSASLDAYFSRLGWTGPAEANIYTLRDLHLMHHGTIPFANMDVLRRNIIQKCH